LFGYFIVIVLRVTQNELFDVLALFMLMSLLLMINLITLSVTVILQNDIIPIELTNIKEIESQFNRDNKINVGPKELSDINDAMISKNLYLDPNLTINDLAKELNTPAYIISKQINQGFEKTFFNYVNNFRIEHAKKLLSSTDIKILAVALDSGFSNKSSFHRTFKRIVGTTPYEYRLTLQI
jgi:YesN/AraC family two-component response regulator